MPAETVAVAVQPAITPIAKARRKVLRLGFDLFIPGGHVLTGARHYYRLESAAPGPPGVSPLPGLIDRTAFRP